MNDEDDGIVLDDSSQDHEDSLSSYNSGKSAVSNL